MQTSLTSCPRSRAWMFVTFTMSVCGLSVGALGDAGGAGAPTGERPRLLERMLTERDATRPAMCYVQDPTPEQLERIMQMTQAMPPTQGNMRPDRYFVSNSLGSWTSAGNASGTTGQAARANLTYSFPIDGVTWGTTQAGQTVAGPNTLTSRLNGVYGASNTDRGREFIRQALAGWRKYAGIGYSEVADDNVNFTQATAHVTTRGDIRIGCVDDATALGLGILAYNFFPTGGGDMTLIGGQFVPGALSGSGSNYLYLRNVVSHEHGHGLGFIHPVPCTNTKLMEPFASTAFDMLQTDERRGGGRQYGDRYSGNNGTVSAVNYGDITSRSVIERGLSTNGTAGPLNSDEDWFKFTLTAAQPVVISAAPTGLNATQGAQSSGCSGTLATVNAPVAGNLTIELRDSSGGTVLQTANTAAAGLTETLNAGTLAAGTYYVRIVDAGPNTAADQFVQLYDMTILVNNQTAPPMAIAGLNKRIAANTNCFFMGDINSQANQAGGSITGYAWDFDNDGVFENAFTQPSRQYVSNGVHNVTLRVTDNNGRTATDTITVTVFNAVTTLTAVSPVSGPTGTTVPVTITGTNLKGVSAASQITVSGTGVNVVGTPVPNHLGTSITGLSFQIDIGATLGLRNVSVTNSDGSGGSATGNNLFTVTQGGPANDECAGYGVLASGFGPRPFTNVNATNSPDQNFGGTGCTGPINNDVWYDWFITSGMPTVSLTTDSAGSGFASRVAVYVSADCPVGAPIACAENGASLQFVAMPFTDYLIRVGSMVAGQTGSANLIFTEVVSNGACCALDGSCTSLTSGDCATAGGVFQGTGTVCSPNPCPPATGACCSGSICTVTLISGCTGPNTSFAGVLTTCNAPSGNYTTPCCKADFNKANGIGVQDIFDFLAAWFNMDPRSDINGANGVTVQDIFDFLAAWFAGGC